MQETTIPVWFKTYLQNLPFALTVELFEWVDGTSDAPLQIIDVLGENEEKFPPGYFIDPDEDLAKEVV
jgi:hypothetical protein